MFEDQIFEEIMECMLNSIFVDIDIREGSVIYNVLVLVVVEFVKLYIWLDIVFELVFFDIV